MIENKTRHTDPKKKVIQVKRSSLKEKKRNYFTVPDVVCIQHKRYVSWRYWFVEDNSITVINRFVDAEDLLF